MKRLTSRQRFERAMKRYVGDSVDLARDRVGYGVEYVNDMWRGWQLVQRDAARSARKLAGVARIAKRRAKP